MKKLVLLLASLLCLFAFTACDVSALLGQFKPNAQSSETASSEEETSSEDSQVGGDVSEDDGSDDSQQVVEKHPHNLKRVSARQSTCEVAGNILHWYCETCEKYFSDVNGTAEITYEETLKPKSAHVTVEMPGKEPTCAEAGKYTYYVCTKCGNTFLDEECTQECDKDEIVIDALPHEMVHHEAVSPVGKTDGVKEHWTCTICKNYYLEEEGVEKVTQAETVWYALENLVDFTVEVEEGRDPIVLQLTDTQIIDAGQTRPDRDSVDHNFWATDKMDERCFDYVTEIITATNPDFIIITGDVIYGEFDDNGSVWVKFIEFMEGFQIPWSPIFGNHDNESKMGVDWQCEQLENAEYCLFEQKTLTGNGNYSVGIVQGDELKRVFYMMDSNGCGAASEESLANGHTVTSVGFGKDQVEWYTEEITLIKTQSPDTKISFAYHIQQAIFGSAFNKYDEYDPTIASGSSSALANPLNLDTLETADETDFGYIGRVMKGPWDTNKSIYNGMKALGVDSIFVGHEHCNSSSIVYDGVRFQYGQKSSEYDRFNSIDENGVITGQTWIPGGNTSLIGGTVIVLSEEDATIEDAYIYYCSSDDGKIANGEINWDKYKPIDVNGLQMGTAQDEIGVAAVEFDETTNAYQLKADAQGKAFIDPDILKGKSSVTFSIFVPEGCNIINNWGAFVLRFKVSSDNGSIAQLPGAYNDETNKYYQIYKESATDDALKIVPGEWKTYTVDISGWSNECTEFAFLIAAGNTLYLKDVTVS